MFLDIGAGILAAIGVSAWYGTTATIGFAIAGAVMALSPDLDFLYCMLCRRSALRHREGLHYPLIFTPIGALLFLYFGAPWALLFVLASLGHFIHDSIGVGWGVQWLYPFQKDHYSFFYIYKPRWRRERLPQQWLYIWKHEEIEALDARYGDPDWVRNIYFKWHPYAIAEFAVFVIGILAFLFYRK